MKYHKVLSRRGTEQFIPFDTMAESYAPFTARLFVATIYNKGKKIVLLDFWTLISKTLEDLVYKTSTDFSQKLRDQRDLRTVIGSEHNFV